jgi:peptidoglycan/xylan/chitin deacetylase (PgdA/CDA1 family)
MTAPMRALRDFVLHVIRACGGFRLARYLTRNRLRILCYHGFSLGDECEFAPYMFMRVATFERRMDILKKRRVPVIPLEEAIRRLENRDISNCETVITFDDGWLSTLTVGVPLLARYGFPACVYVTTEHLDAGMEVFNVALYYMMCRTRLQTLVLAGVHTRLDGSYDLGGNREATHAALIKAAEEAFPAIADRQRLLTRIAAALQLELPEVLANGRFSLVDRAAIQELATSGHEVQLHTHSHRLPDGSFGEMAAEIERNQASLRALLGTEQRHLCYPSGRYSPRHLEWLARLGIVSGTTCDPGLNPPGSQLLLLKRYLDNDQASDIAFEAEICGLRDLARNFRATVGSALSGAAGRA